MIDTARCYRQHADGDYFGRIGDEDDLFAGASHQRVDQGERHAQLASGTRLRIRLYRPCLPIIME